MIEGAIVLPCPPRHAVPLFGYINSSFSPMSNVLTGVAISDEYLSCPVGSARGSHRVGDWKLQVTRRQASTQGYEILGGEEIGYLDIALGWMANLIGILKEVSGLKVIMRRQCRCCRRGWSHLPVIR